MWCLVRSGDKSVAPVLIWILGIRGIIMSFLGDNIMKEG
jgi:hypothetical protein